MMNSSSSNTKRTKNGVSVLLPDGGTMRATHTAELPINTLPYAARQAHLFPALSSDALLSIGQLCDHGCREIFNASTVNIINNHKLILQGQRNLTNGMWVIQLPAHDGDAPPVTAPSPNKPIACSTSNQTTHANITTPAPKQAIACSAIEHKTKVDLVTFLHAACFSPATSTFLRNVKAGYFATWPGLTPELITKHLPKSIASVKGHLNQQHKNVRSTKPNPPKPSPEPSFERLDQRTNLVFANVFEPAGQIYTNLSGRFPIQSNRGNQYIFVLYDYDSNAKLAEPMKNRTDRKMVRAFKHLHAYLCDRGLPPKLQKLDNEVSAALKHAMREEAIDYQLVPPHIHHRNAAKRAIWTFKNHFSAGLCSVDPNFPLQLWDRLLPQATTTLNLLRASRLNPQLSSEAQLNGAFDYNRTPLAPPGTKVIVHETSSVRQSWAPHGVNGWYIGAASHHYRCWRVFIPQTAGERNSDTVEFFPATVPMPQLSSADAATQAIQDLIQALKHPHPATPFATLGNAQYDAIKQLAQIFAGALPNKGDKNGTLKNASEHATSVRDKHGTCTNASKQATSATQSPPNSTKLGAPLPAPRVFPPVLRAVSPVTRNTTNRYTGGPLRQPAPRYRYPTRSQTLTNQTLPRANHVATISGPLFPLPTSLSQHVAHSVLDPITGQSLEYRQLSQGPTRDKWIHGFANEIGRLAQGIGTRMPTGTDTIHFIKREQVPSDRKVTYGHIVATIRPQKSETHRVRLTVGGNLIDHPGDVSTPTADMTTTKILFNSVISTPDARFMCTDVKDFCLNTPMARYEYMRLPLHILPQEIVDQYKPLPLVTNGWIYVKIWKGMYGLPQAGIIANQRLEKHLAKYGYKPTYLTPSLWRHEFRPITFSLVVDDFGEKYVGDQHARHLITALEHLYTVSSDWTGSLYCGLTLDWDYTNRLRCHGTPQISASATIAPPTRTAPMDPARIWRSRAICP
jgi:hypothetical protein